ncbi:MAG: cytochrome c nitrite reductase small subunit [Campylobacterales bacterium]
MVHLRFKTAVAALLIVAAGWLLGSGVYTFWYAKGFSYLSDKPEACANCHVMNNVYEGWSKGGHQHVATCNDCHVPHNFAGKWWTKAQNGYHHAYAFTLKELPSVLEATAGSKAIAQNNCIRCHGELAGHAISATLNPQADALSCIHCHRSVGHPHN